MKDVQADVSLETADCLVRKTGFGHDVVTNICTNSISYVPWQFGDWAGFLTVALMAIIVFGFVGVMVWSIATGRL